MKYFLLMLSALLTMSASPPINQGGDPMVDMYRVAMKISIDDLVVGAPSFLMRNGSTATTTRAGAAGYALKTEVNRVGAEAERRVALVIDL